MPGWPFDVQCAQTLLLHPPSQDSIPPSLPPSRGQLLLPFKDNYSSLKLPPIRLQIDGHSGVDKNPVELSRISRKLIQAGPWCAPSTNGVHPNSDKHTKCECPLQSAPQAKTGSRPEGLAFWGRMAALIPPLCPPLPSYLTQRSTSVNHISVQVRGSQELWVYGSGRASCHLEFECSALADLFLCVWLLEFIAKLYTILYCKLAWKILSFCLYI